MTLTNLQPSAQANSLQLLQYVEPVSAIDTISDYFFFLADSLNPLPVDSTFRFEIREIILPEPVLEDTVVIRPSLLQTHQPKPVDMKPVEHQASQYDFITLALVLILVLLAWGRHFFSRRLRQIFKAFYAPHHVNQLVRDGNLIRERIMPGLAIIYILATASFAFGLINRFISIPVPEIDAVWIFAFLVSAITIIWISKNLLVSFTGSLFRVAHFASEFILTNIVFNIVTGLIVFPVVFSWFYTGEATLLYVIAGIYIIIYSYRFLRLFLVGLKVQSFSVVYLFLYLCTLEILPVLILAKLINLFD
ncbi:MAG: DUF4271 domain-containing protein [Lentimicrobium sp.]|jgi:hypothetical protein|nr:DUF4271 domain-containing protein [Lentimicrobium sp.]MDD2526990.1 DUF4271 domain-containing protein [Lentimicrobiaceae bacterium]MDY0025004.1 DUF4271 domain-containing protein [Lentimicrobium sp.]